MSSIYKNLFYTIASNIVSFACSVLITLIIPKRLGIDDYGYFQLYLFYTTYIGFLHFGWADGVLLRYGGAYYEKLDKPKINAQFLMYSGVEIAIGFLVILFGIFGGSGEGRMWVIIFTGISIVFTLPRTFLQYILQATNRIKEYAFLTVVEKIIYLSVTIIVLFTGTKSFIPILVADILGKAISFVYSALKCTDLIKTQPENIKDAISETKLNISVGIKLMFANIASLLIIGLVRLAIERQWDVATFGKVSLTMSVSNMLMVFIHAIASVLFPMLRRAREEQLSEIYSLMRLCLMTALLGMLVVYYPIKEVLSLWLPQYADSLAYMALLFPMCIYESKMSMLIETYMKTIRLEKKLLLVNVITMFLSILLTGITVYKLHNLDMAIGMIVVVLAFRCICAELMLAKKMQIFVKFDIIQEVLLTVGFIISNWTIGGVAGVGIYIVLYIVYLILHFRELRDVVNRILKRKAIS